MNQDTNGEYFQDIWNKVYNDGRQAGHSPYVAAQVASRAISELPEELKKEIILRTQTATTQDSPHDH